MIIFVTLVHVLVSILLILIVLMQQGKGQDLASAFGGGGSQTAFGARGTATLLSKITAGCAIMFMVTSLTLGYLKPAVSSGGDTVIPDAPAASQTSEEAAEEAPESEAAPAETPPPPGESDESGAESGEAEPPEPQ